PLQIKKALEKEFSDREIYLSEVHKATAKFYCKKRKIFQTMLHPFGCALMDDGSADSYRWVLRQTKLAIGGCVPSIVITDADMALELAIFE
ncbi:14369_t:CDS:2, partial [Gigaspora rosea]